MKNRSIPVKYLRLSREELLEKARELGVSYEKNSGSCSECAAAALRGILGFEDIVVKVACSSCGGQAGLSMGACGGVMGGTIVLDYYLGRPASLASLTKMIREGREELRRACKRPRLLVSN